MSCLQGQIDHKSVVLTVFIAAIGDVDDDDVNGDDDDDI